MSAGLTAPQARGLRWYAAPQPRIRHEATIGARPRGDVVTRLEDLGLVEQIPGSFDMRLTDEGHRTLQAEASRRGWELGAASTPKFAVDADCPGCGYPERSFDPVTGVFACSSLNRNRCDYTSTERDR